MKYKRILVPAIVIPKQEEGRPYWQGQALPEFSVVGVMKNNQPSPITKRKNEILVRWKDVAGRETLGWLAKNTPMDDKMSKKELSRGIGEIRLGAWDAVRSRISAHPTWTAKKWLCAFADTNLALLHAVIRELGGKVPKSDDPFLAIRQSLKLITGEDITMKEAAESKKNTKLTKKNGKKSTKKSNKKEKKTGKKKSSKKAARRAGRTSGFAGMRIVRVGQWIKENPRREGSTGYESWNKIKKGMTYEEFIKAGGNPGSLRVEVAKGRVKMKKA